MKPAFVFIVALLMLSVSAFTQTTSVPPMMNFQGRLAKPDGTPVPDGSYQITFSIFAAPTGGAALWTQTMNPVVVHNGVFAVLLGNGNPVTADMLNGTPYLEIKVGSNNPLPRQQFASVAFAFKANAVADGSITNVSLANGTLTADKFSDGAFNSLAWLLGGNSGITSGFLGTTDNQPLVFKVNGYQAMRYAYAENTMNPYDNYRSINVLGGSDVNTIGAGVIGATIAGGGFDSFNGTGSPLPNTVKADFGTIAGGYKNTVSGFGSVIGGGSHNTVANKSFDFIGGGQANTASGGYTTVAGGQGNVASGAEAAVGGGDDNTASGIDATIGGGLFNTSGGYATIVAGGSVNVASGDFATIGGGSHNAASGFYATVGGGIYNTAAGQYSFAAGQQAQANHDGTFVWNDSTNPYLGGTAYNYFASTGPNQFLIHATGGVGINTNSPAGFALNVNGSVQCASLTQTSDARYKTNVATINNAFDDILNLRGVTYDWKRDEFKDKHFPEGRQIGFIAQEVEQIFPELVFTDSDGYKSVAYANVVPILVEAMKQQDKKIEAQQKEIDEFKKQNAEIAELKRQVAALLAATQQNAHQSH